MRWNVLEMTLRSKHPWISHHVCWLATAVDFESMQEILRDRMPDHPLPGTRRRPVW